MVLTPEVFVLAVSAIFFGFAVLAAVAEWLDVRDARKLRDLGRQRLREETWKRVAS